MFCFGILIPIIAYTALFFYRSYVYTSVLGPERQFDHCEITQYDPETGSTYKQTETIKIVQVNHGIKLVEAETFMGAIFGLGFIHAKDRLWQLNFYRYLTSGRLAEIVGPDGVPVDRYVRTIGMPRAARSILEGLNDTERNFLQNYCNGVNKAAKNVKLYPAEFYILFTGFEEFTIEDVAGMLTFFGNFLARDWDTEYLRGRLTEIYDRELVDRLLPFEKKNYFDLGNMETIKDHELEEFGFHVPDNAENLYRIDEDLFHLRKKTKDKIEFNEDFNERKWAFENLASDWSMAGSNCWAIHGNFTKQGKPIL